MKTETKTGAAIALILAASTATATVRPMFECDDVNRPNFPNPIAPCAIATAHHVPCVTGITDSANWKGGTTASPGSIDGAPVGMPFQGTSITTVHQNFVGVIDWDWNKLTAAQLNVQFKLLGPVDLARFSQAYYLASGGKMTALMTIAKAKLTAANYAVFLQAFNSANATTIPQSAAAHVKAGAVHPTMNGLSGGIAAPTVDMTFREIYTEYLFTEAMTVEQAVFLAAKFAASELSTAAFVGWKIGSNFYAFANYIDPDYGYDLVTTYGQESDFGTPDIGVTITVGPLIYDDEWAPTSGGGC